MSTSAFLERGPSRCKWLKDHFEGHWHGGHHDWRVPEECRDYLVFSVIRNPYEIQASGWFFEPIIKPKNCRKPKTYAEAVKAWVRPPDKPVSQKELVWQGSEDDFVFFGYERYDCGPPKNPIGIATPFTAPPTPLLARVLK